MQIDGKTQAIAFGSMALLGFVAALSPSMFPSYIPAGEAADIAKTAGLLGGALSSVGAACWAAFKPMGEVLKAHPSILTGKLATDIEAKRLAVIAARNLCNNVACNVLFTEEANMAQGFVKNLPISVSVNVTPVNLFAQACAAIPTLQTAASVPAPITTPVTGN